MQNIQWVYLEGQCRPEQGAQVSLSVLLAHKRDPYEKVAVLSVGFYQKF